MADIYHYMIRYDIPFLGIMFASTTTTTTTSMEPNLNNHHDMKRQLMLCTINKYQFPLQDLISYLLHQDGTLQLTEIVDDDVISILQSWNHNNNNIHDDNGHPHESMTVLSFEQGKTEASRKQVAPLIIRFVETNTISS